MWKCAMCISKFFPLNDFKFFWNSKSATHFCYSQFYFFMTQHWSELTLSVSVGTYCTYESWNDRCNLKSHLKLYSSINTSILVQIQYTLSRKINRATDFNKNWSSFEVFTISILFNITVCNIVAYVALTHFISCNLNVWFSWL